MQNPNAKGGTQISRELGQEGSVLIAALLEKAVYQHDEAAAMKEEKKERASKVCSCPASFCHFLSAVMLET